MGGTIMNEQIIPQQAVWWKWYRIVADDGQGYEVQAKRIWWPFWVQCHDGSNYFNTHATLQQAHQFIQRKQSRHIVVQSQ